MKDVKLVTQSVITQFTGKEVVNDVVEHFTTLIENGTIDPLRFHVQAKMMIKALESVVESTMENAMLERAKYGKEADILGATITEIESGIKYDYDSTGDLEYSHIKAAYENILKQKKAREKWLQQMTKTENVADIDGVFHTITPPAKYSKTTLKVTYK